MIRFIFAAGTVVLFLIFSIPVLAVLWLVGKKDLHKKEVASLKIVQGVFRAILWMSGVKVTVKGLDRIPRDQAVLYIGNHRSYFDILVGYVTVPGLMGFVAKKEMLHYPLLSNWMRYVNCLFLDRVNMKEGLKTILTGIQLVKRGVSVWIFPEGTRNRNQDPRELLPFKEGSLKIGEKAGCPVVPVAMTGTAKVFENQFPRIRPSHVVIEFGEPFWLKELPPEPRKFPGAYTRDVIMAMLDQQLGRQEDE